MLAQALQLLTKNKLYATSNCFLSHVHVSHRNSYDKLQAMFWENTVDSKGNFNH